MLSRCHTSLNIHLCLQICWKDIYFHHSIRKEYTAINMFACFLIAVYSFYICLVLQFSSRCCNFQSDRNKRGSAFGHWRLCGRFGHMGPREHEETHLESMPRMLLPLSFDMFWKLLQLAAFKVWKVTTSLSTPSMAVEADYQAISGGRCLWSSLIKKISQKVISKYK